MHLINWLAVGPERSLTSWHRKRVFLSTNARLRPKVFSLERFLPARTYPRSRLRVSTTRHAANRHPSSLCRSSAPCPWQLPRFLAVLPERKTLRTGKPAGGRDLAHGNPAARRACQHERGRRRCCQSGIAGPARAPALRRGALHLPCLFGSSIAPSVGAFSPLPLLVEVIAGDVQCSTLTPPVSS
jgi:hypothetical protein